MEIKVVIRVLFPLIYLNATLPFARELSLKTYSVCALKMSRAIPKRDREGESMSILLFNQMVNVAFSLFVEWI